LAAKFRPDPLVINVITFYVGLLLGLLLFFLLYVLTTHVTVCVICYTEIKGYLLTNIIGFGHFYYIIGD